MSRGMLGAVPVAAYGVGLSSSRKSREKGGGPFWGLFGGGGKKSR